MAFTKTQVDRMVNVAAIITASRVNGYIKHTSQEANIMLQAARMVQRADDVVAYLKDHPEALDGEIDDVVEPMIEELKKVKKERVEALTAEKAEEAADDTDEDESGDTEGDGDFSADA